MRHFQDHEVIGLDSDFAVKLDDTREAAGVPFEITSGVRVSPPGKPKSHDRGLATDLRCGTSYRRMRIVSAALRLGAHCMNCGSHSVRFTDAFRRIGVYDLHVHLDVDKKAPQDVMWWGESK